VSDAPESASPNDAEPMPAPVAAAVDACWPRAQQRWAPFLLLRPPVHAPEGLDLARIDLATREVAVNGRTIVEQGLVPCVEAILAHEVGHHVRYPGTMVVSARLQLLERQLIPMQGYNFANLFTDLLINAELAELAEPVGDSSPSLRDDLIRIYQSFQSRKDWGRDSSFLFYLAVYEELWRLEPGALVGEKQAAAMAARFPEHRADAQLMAQDLFRLGPNIYTQFIYFLSVMSRYLQVPEEGKSAHNGDPLRCGHGVPSADDWADALTPTLAEKEAIARARAEGWISDESAERLTDREALDRRIASLPGQGGAVAEEVPEVMAAYYRRQAEQHLVTPPPRMVLGDAIVPTTLEEWDVGEPMAEIDWIATLRLRGEELGGIAPLRRERIAEYEGADIPIWQRQVEIYLDVSGSMPDPRRTINAMTLGALVLAIGAIRAGGAVRALLYSGSSVRFWEWCRSELEISRFLMHYIGGGTVFPFETLAESVAEHRTSCPVRVVITDSDFDRNHDAAAAHGRIFAEAARRSGPLVLLLHAPARASVERYRGVGAQVVAVQKLEDFPAMAAALGRALFAETRA
jgi:hypothetical protein